MADGLAEAVGGVGGLGVSLIDADAVDQAVEMTVEHRLNDHLAVAELGADGIGGEADGLANFLEGGFEQAFFGEELFGGVQQGIAPLFLNPGAPGGAPGLAEGGAGGEGGGPGAAFQGSFFLGTGPCS